MHKSSFIYVMLCKHNMNRITFTEDENKILILLLSGKKTMKQFKKYCFDVGILTRKKGKTPRQNSQGTSQILYRKNIGLVSKLESEKWIILNAENGRRSPNSTISLNFNKFYRSWVNRFYQSGEEMPIGIKGGVKRDIFYSRPALFDLDLMKPLFFHKRKWMFPSVYGFFNLCLAFRVPSGASEGPILNSFIQEALFQTQLTKIQTSQSKFIEQYLIASEQVKQQITQQALSKDSTQQPFSTMALAAACHIYGTKKADIHYQTGQEDRLIPLSEKDLKKEPIKVGYPWASILHQGVLLRYPQRKLREVLEYATLKDVNVNLFFEPEPILQIYQVLGKFIAWFK
ncbi:Uncharacterised protein [Candidatus Bilamarchaeum dharawalense]|uniref:Uncharacterized protein n=1 Tax=Candidatus Bilamarchaeum dharawalense TaxID=2885759 RepID=A0A5E4LN02_9ARCH|nr:Uncharacterised protein [Candidatus Bilamarchaeum dharawalense]